MPKRKTKPLVEEETKELEVTPEVEKLLAKNEEEVVSEPAEESNTSAEETPKLQQDKIKFNNLVDVKHSLNAQSLDSDNTAIIDIELGALKRKRIRINNDPNKIIELNTSDLNVASRLTETYNKLLKMMDRAFDTFQQLPDDVDSMSDEVKAAVDELDHIDKEMRDEVDYIFDYPVSDVCLEENASMWSPVDGMFTFEYIIENLLPLYESRMTNEFRRMRLKAEKESKRRKAQLSKFHK